MKNVKKFSVLSCLSLIALALAFAFTSCGKDKHTCPTLTFSPDKVDVTIKKLVTVTINGGTAPYEVRSCDDNIAKVAVDKNTITITGVNPGKAMIAVADKNKITGTLSVTIVTGDLDSDKPVNTTVNEGRETVVTVKGGVTPYAVKSDDPKTATATINADKVTITGVKFGKTTITVTGADKKTVGTINVTVIEVKQLGKLDSKNKTINVAMKVGQEGFVLAEGATTVVPKDPTTVKFIDVKNNKIAIEGLKAGKTTITVTGLDKKEIGTINVDVTNK